jgi:hypothetical protein
MARNAVIPEAPPVGLVSAHLRRSLTRPREFGTARPMEGRKAGYGEGTGLKEGPEYGVSRRVGSRSRDRSTAPGDWPATFRETGLSHF